MICDSQNNFQLIKDLLKLEIKCFQHCSKNSRFLCLKVPDACPVCSLSLYSTSTNFRVPPFSLPKNLTSSSQLHVTSNSLLLIPTNGDFNPWFLFSSMEINEDYGIGDLHIGVTNSKSEIFDFDVNGLNKNSNIWSRTPSIIIRLDKNIQIGCNLYESNDSRNNFDFKSKEFSKKWDLALERKFLNHEKWNRINYNEENFNCFDFVIEHLLEFEFFEYNLEYLTFSEGFQNDRIFLKKKLSHDLIEPEFIKCLKYLNLIKTLNEKHILEEKLN